MLGSDFIDITSCMLSYTLVSFSLSAMAAINWPCLSCSSSVDMPYSSPSIMKLSFPLCMSSMTPMVWPVWTGVANFWRRFFCFELM